MKMKIRTLVINPEEVAIVAENKDYIILYEADIYHSVNGLEIQGAYDIVGTDGNTRIQDMTNDEDTEIKGIIKAAYNDKYFKQGI